MAEDGGAVTYAVDRIFGGVSFQRGHGKTRIGGLLTVFMMEAAGRSWTEDATMRRSAMKFWTGGV